MSIEDPKALGGSAGATSPGLQDRASQDLSQVGSKAKEDLDAISRRAAEDARELGHQAQEKAGEAAEKAKSFAQDQKDLAAGQINGVASAISRVADELDGSDQQTIARYARDLANGISNVGRQVEQRDIDDLMGAAQDFGRKQPLAFLGAAALAGFVASRFALASSHRRATASTSPVQPQQAPSTQPSATYTPGTQSSSTYSSSTSSSYGNDTGLGGQSGAR